jgi:hypothetical protein
MLSHFPEPVLQAIVEEVATDLGYESSSNAESVLDDNLSEDDNQTSFSDEDTDAYGETDNSDEDMINIDVCSRAALSKLPAISVELTVIPLPRHIPTRRLIFLKAITAGMTSFNQTLREASQTLFLLMNAPKPLYVSSVGSSTSRLNTVLGPRRLCAA